ncbi:MAG: hypothetical protein LC130_23100 [Bryobacterales bacterium]|nr:hypothetical protein [Bryobacterales bacterium]
MEANRKRVIARKQPCGCVVGCISYLPDGEAYARKQIAEWEAKGYRVEWVVDPKFYVKFVGESGCPHKPPEPVQLSLF